LITSVEAIERYVAKLNGLDGGTGDRDEPPLTRSKRRQAELARVDRELDEFGIKESAMQGS
jgi:hypothetical protein